MKYQISKRLSFFSRSGSCWCCTCPDLLEYRRSLFGQIHRCAVDAVCRFKLLICARAHKVALKYKVAVVDVFAASPSRKKFQTSIHL